MVKPKVSIIVPIYNVEPYFEECVDSLRKQTMEDIEIILVDDGSPDGCPAMCDRFAAEDKRIRVIHQENAGVSVARNRGIDIAAGGWLMFVDPDDWLEENAVELLYDKAIESGCAIVYTPFYMNYFDRQTWRKLNPDEVGIHSDEQSLTFLLERSLGIVNGTLKLRSPCGSIYERSNIVCNQCCFPAGLKYGEDAIFNLYAVFHAKEIYILDVPLYHYRQNSQSVSHMPLEDEQDVLRCYSREIYRFFQKYHLLDEFQPYYYYAMIDMVLYISKANNADVRSWDDLKKAILSLRQFSEEPECSQAIRTAKINFMPTIRRRIACWLLKKKLYWAVVLMSYLYQRLSKGNLY